MRKTLFVSFALAALALAHTSLPARAEDAAKPAEIEKAADPSKGPPSGESPAPAEKPAGASELLEFLKPADAPALPPKAPAEALPPEAPAPAPAPEPDPAPAAPPKDGETAAAPAPIPADGRERYEIDPVHSSVQFKVKHLFSYVTGKFSDVSGTVLVDPKEPANSAVNVTIKTASIGTNEEKRDAHLRSEEFFDAEKFPEIKFESQRINVTGEDSAFIIGTLSMHGVDREVILETKFLGKGKGMEGRQHTGWEAKTAVKRSDFGLSWSKAIEGTALVGDDIAISMEIDAVEPKIEAIVEAAPPTAAPESETPAKSAAEAAQPVAPEGAAAPDAAAPAAPVPAPENSEQKTVPPAPIPPAIPANPATPLPAPPAPEPPAPKAPEAPAPKAPEPPAPAAPAQPDPAPAKNEQGVNPL